MNLRHKTLNEVLNAFFNVVSDHEMHLLSPRTIDAGREAWFDIA